MNNFGNKKTVVDGITFDSQKEAARWQELKLMQRAGLICELQRQVPFVLIPKQERNGKVIERPVVYKADFVYRENGEDVVEDVKSNSLKEGVMSYRQMMLQGIIDAPPPFDPPIDGDPARQLRRDRREAWLKSLPPADPRERVIDYGRPLMKYGNEEALCEKLRSIQTPTLIIGGAEDPISTPELMMRTAKCLPHCKLVMYSNCGHNIDTDIIEEVCEETDRFLQTVRKTGRCYSSCEEA